MMIIQHKFSAKLLGIRYTAMCIWPFLFIKPGTDLTRRTELLNHEKIHARQQLEMLWLFFFLWYGVEYLIRLIRYHDLHRAYKELSHEREARENDGDPGYLLRRKPFAWIRYLVNKQ
jgi:hypothetical protein